MQKIAPCLWFDNKAEEAAKFYVSVFKKSKIGKTSYYDEGSSKVSGRPKGSVMTVTFKLNGQKFTALNGGPLFKFSEAISLMVPCKTQKEIDYYWEKLSAGGAKSECGWLKDKYGVSWQIVPAQIGKMISGKSSAKSSRVMDALLKMKKLDIKKLEQAYNQKNAE